MLWVVLLGAGQSGGLTDLGNERNEKVGLTGFLLCGHVLWLHDGILPVTCTGCGEGGLTTGYGRGSVVATVVAPVMVGTGPAVAGV